MSNIQIIIDILESKKEEILNYDLSEDWADNALNAIQWFIDNNSTKE